VQPRPQGQVSSDERSDRGALRRDTAARARTDARACPMARSGSDSRPPPGTDTGTPAIPRAAAEAVAGPGVVAMPADRTGQWEVRRLADHSCGGGGGPPPPGRRRPPPPPLAGPRPGERGLLHPVLDPDPRPD